MTWRKRGKYKYYERSVDGQRVYVGRGHVADLISDLDKADRMERRHQLNLEREVRRRWEHADGIALAFMKSTDKMVAAHFMAAGYHQHDRGEWRKRQRIEPMETGMDAANEELGRQYFDGTIDLAQQAEEAWLELIADGDPIMITALRQQLRQSQMELRRPGDSALETLLVRHMALTQLQAAFADLSYAASAGASLAQAKFLLDRQRIFSRRLTDVAKTLSTLRQLCTKSKRRWTRATAS